jgi:tetratricopeptide (TPR) repeat protein
LKVGSESKERLTRAHTGNTEAYDLYLKGRYSWEKWTQDGAKQAVQFFDEAIKKDPNYALAYSGLADAYMFGPTVGPGVPQREAHRRAREAATKALFLDPQLGETHAALAVVLLYADWDFAGAEREFKRAIELSPSYAEGHHQYSHLLLLLGRIDESFVESKKLLELDPVSETPIGHLGYNYLYARQNDEAIQQFHKALQLYPDASEHTLLGDACYEKGMFREAVEEYLKGLAQSGSTAEKTVALREAFAKAGIKGYLQKRIEQLKAGPQTERDDVGIAMLYARLGEKDQALASLEKAYAEHADGLVHLREELAFDSLRADPRFTDLLRRIGLMP